ncbi:uncharacterized protein A4U43_C04F2190 [Asparagus officinalis]|uniref:Uncharacterized protein n=1 Tax=Asparagus officinalis TaxID=4686 RepID=A0A5P1EY46_ASPOF|nr:uncharacterized protein A4U43_C04F2190 [Asparagus officinalis]
MKRHDAPGALSADGPGKMSIKSPVEKKSAKPSLGVARSLNRRGPQTCVRPRLLASRLRLHRPSSLLSPASLRLQRVPAASITNTRHPRRSTTAPSCRPGPSGRESASDSPTSSAGKTEGLQGIAEVGADAGETSSGSPGGEGVQVGALALYPGTGGCSPGWMRTPTADADGVIVAGGLSPAGMRLRIELRSGADVAEASGRWPVGSCTRTQEEENDGGRDDEDRETNN